MHTLHQWGKTYAIIFSPFLPFDHISPQKLVWPYPPPPSRGVKQKYITLRHFTKMLFPCESLADGLDEDGVVAGDAEAVGLEQVALYLQIKGGGQRAQQVVCRSPRQSNKINNCLKLKRKGKG